MLNLLIVLTNSISLITVAQLLLFGIFLLTASKKKSKDKIVLALFLFANSIYILNFLIFRYRNIIVPYSLDFFYLGHTFGFLFGPLLYLYTSSVNSKDFKFRIKDALHFIPFIISFFITLFLFQLASYQTKIMLLQTGLFGETGSVINFLIMNVSILIYLVFSFFSIRKRNQSLKGFYSSLEKINYNWLKIVVFAFFIMWTIDIVHWIAATLGLTTRISSELLNLVSLSINFVFANILILKSLRLPETGEVVEIHRYEKSSLTIQAKTEILSRVEKLMNEEKLFLNPSLTLGEVSQKLSVISRYLSQVINELKGQNFYDFVNNYRIEEAKRMLTDSSHSNEKILSVLYDCGFNSKSVFNTVFKKNTGVTPSEYRKKYKQSA